MYFVRPTKEQTSDAIGNISHMSEEMKHAFSCDCLFSQIPDPQPADWLAENFEPGQRYSDFIQARTRVPGKGKNRIYLQPLGLFDPERSPSLERLKACTQAYYTLGVRVLDPLTDMDRIRKRVNRFTGMPQLRSSDLMDLLISNRPADAFCMIGITMEDLYPEERWNFVFGEASPAQGVGVFSFARYDPCFYDESWDDGSSSLLLKRSCKVLVHETAHMLSMSHCIYFHCIMNGSNHIEESDKRPLHFCPVCLRKLQSSTGFEIVTWYKRLLLFFQSCSFGEEAGWVEKRLDFILKGNA